MPTLTLRWKVVAKLVRAHGWKRGAELGVWKGQTLFHLLDTCPDLTMIGVDKWQMGDTPHQKDMDKGLSTWYPADVVQGYRYKVLEKAKEYNGRLMILEMDTVEAASHVEDASIDFAFVDASHTTESVFADVNAWRPKIRPGGALLGHDRQWNSVRRALDRLFPEGFESHADNVWFVAVK
jgi:hypothetical protein